MNAIRIVQLIIASGLVILFTSSCEKPDYSKPHVYLKYTAYGNNWESTKNNETKFWLTDRFKKYFPIGTGSCESYLSKIEAERVLLEMAATNAIYNTELKNRDDVRIRHVVIQCVEHHGNDHGCQEKVKEIAAKIWNSISREDALAYLGRNIFQCEIENAIGSSRTFTLPDKGPIYYVPG